MRRDANLMRGGGRRSALLHATAPVPDCGLGPVRPGNAGNSSADSDSAVAAGPVVFAQVGGTGKEVLAPGCGPGVDAIVAHIEAALSAAGVQPLCADKKQQHQSATNGNGAHHHDHSHEHGHDHDHQHH